MFSLSLRSGAAPRGVRPIRPASFQLVSALPRPALAKLGSSSDDRRSAVRVPGLPPGSGLLFRSFVVRFVHGSYLKFVLLFRSLQLGSILFRSSCPVLFRSLRSRFPFVSVPASFFVFELILMRCARSQAIYIIFLAYIIHYWGRFSNVFFVRKHVVFKNSADY